MATFPSITPTYGLQKSSAPNVRKVQFGDGYEARLTYGASFDFAPPGEGSSSKFVCEQWSKSIPYLDRATIQATFRQVFEP